MTTVKFSMGRVVMTRGFVGLFDGDRMLASVAAQELLGRHARGDWGDLDDEDKQANEDAVKDGDRVLSKHTLRGEAVYIITECDRSATTLLLPEEY